MTWKEFGAGFDARVGSMAERATRILTRRAALRAGMVTGAAGVAAITLGESPALALKYSPGCGPTVRCRGCHAQGCPTGYELCLEKYDCFHKLSNKRPHCCFCEWPQGKWIAAEHLGKFGHGIQICYDCVKPPHHAAQCAHWCTCLGECICCNCTTTADVRAEMSRLGALGLPKSTG